MKASDRAGDGSRRHDYAADSPELARALWLVRRLKDAPITGAEIDAARERVRERVFAAIAALPSPSAAAALRPLAGRVTE